MPENRNPLRVRAGRTRRFEGHALTVHRHTHPDPSHHIGACSPDDRAGRSSHVHREGRHIYGGSGSAAAVRDFTRRYGKRKGRMVYGATIGIRKRQLLATRLRAGGRTRPPSAGSVIAMRRRRRK